MPTIKRWHLKDYWKIPLKRSKSPDVIIYKCSGKQRKFCSRIDREALFLFPQFFIYQAIYSIRISIHLCPYVVMVTV